MQSVALKTQHFPVGTFSKEIPHQQSQPWWEGNRQNSSFAVGNVPEYKNLRKSSKFRFYTICLGRNRERPSRSTRLLTCSYLGLAKHPVSQKLIPGSYGQCFADSHLLAKNPSGYYNIFPHLCRIQPKKPRSHYFQKDGPSLEGFHHV